MDHDSPPSSPQPPPSSPFRASQSSPLTRSSPPRRSESSSSSEFDESSHNVKRKRYTYDNPEVPDSDIYWPSADPTNQENNRNEIGEYDGDLGDQDNEGNVNDWEAHTEQSIDNNQGNEGGDHGDQDNEGSVNDLEEHTEQSLERNQGNEGDEDHRVLTDTSSESSSSDESGDSDSSSEASIQESIQSSRGDDNGETSDSEGYSSDDDISEPVTPKIYDGCDLTVEEGVLSIMLLFIKHKLSKVQVGGILKCILKFFLKVFTFPRTQYALFKYVEDLSPVSKERVHYYCSICKYYLGECDRKCILCGGASHKFFQLPLADQIKNLFENHGLADILDKHEREKQAAGVADNVYSDICDGSEFKRSKIDAPYSLTFLGHTDGLSISESSSVSAWPVEYVIVEIPPNLRYRYVLVSGIYIDEHKPYFNSILHPFADELQTLSKEGVKWKHPKTNIEHVTYVSVPQFVVDAPVRASLQNILCPGGKHCCNVCEQKMKKLPSEPVLPGKKKKNRRRVYTFEEHESQLRTEQRMNAQGRETRRREKAAGKEVEPTKGVMGNSILKKFPGCDRSTVVFPEYMHVLICVIKLFFKLWFLKDGPWSLKSKRDRIDEFLLRVRVPDYVTRIPRTTDGFSNWKANELRSFVLFYSPVIFKECMEHKYYDHWMLLVLSLYLLLQTKVTLADITKAGVMLRMFCRDFVTLYKVDFFTYYIHNLIHLPLVVLRSGPLWSNSAFQFESFNGLLKKLIHGTKNQAQELVNNVRLAFGIEFLQHRINAAKSSSFQQCKPLVELKSVVRDYRFLDNEKFLLSKFKYLTVYYRAKINNEVYTSEIYVRQVRRNNFTICYENSNKEKVYGTIKCFLEASSEGSPPLKCALVNKFKIEHLRSLGHTESNQVLPYMIPIADTSSTELINLDQILFKVIRVENYVCLRPNTYEVNL